MKISDLQYAQALYSLLKDQPEQKKAVIIDNFAKFIVKNNDVFRLEKIEKEFGLLWDKENLLTEVEFLSAYELSDSSLKFLIGKVKEMTGAKDLKIIKKVDKSILGGVVIKYGDKIFDASLKSRLEKFKEAMSA